MNSKSKAEAIDEASVDLFKYFEPWYNILLINKYVFNYSSLK